MIAIFVSAYGNHLYRTFENVFQLNFPHNVLLSKVSCTNCIKNLEG